MWILQNFWGGQERVPEDATVLGDGQKLLMEVAQRGQQRQFTISNIWSWLQAYSRYMAVTYVVCRNHVQGRSSRFMYLLI